RFGFDDRDTVRGECRRITAAYQDAGTHEMELRIVGIHFECRRQDGARPSIVALSQEERGEHPTVERLLTRRRDDERLSVHEARRLEQSLGFEDRRELKSVNAVVRNDRHPLTI